MRSLAACFVILGVLHGAVGCGLITEELITEQLQKEELVLRKDITTTLKREVGADIGLQIPSDAVWEVVNVSQGIDKRIVCRLTLTRESLEEFCGQPTVKPAKWSTTKRLIDDHGPHHVLKPGMLKAFRATTIPKGAECLRILIDTEPRDDVAIFIEWFDM